MTKIFAVCLTILSCCLLAACSNKPISTATELPNTKGILPDIYVTQSIDDYLKRTDTVKNYTLNLLD